MQNTEILKYNGKPKDNQILVYEKGVLSFHLGLKQGFKNKKEAQAFYSFGLTVDSMPYSTLYFQKGLVYRRLFPTTRRACKALLARLSS